MSRYVITYDGKLLGCQMLDAFQTDARAEGLLGAWERYPVTVKRYPPNPKCSACEDYEECNLCPAVILAETGDPAGWPEYVCRDMAAMKQLFRGNG